MRSDSVLCEFLTVILACSAILFIVHYHSEVPCHRKETWYSECTSCCKENVHCIVKCLSLPAQLAPYDIDKARFCTGMKYLDCASCCGAVGNSRPETVNCTLNTCQFLRKSPGEL
jgi:hypothetical protein